MKRQLALSTTFILLLGACENTPDEMSGEGEAFESKTIEKINHSTLNNETAIDHENESTLGDYEVNEMFAEMLPGELIVNTADPEWGLSGEYRLNDDTVFFEAIRGNQIVDEEGEISFETDARFLDSNGRPIRVFMGGDGFLDSSWQAEVDFELSDQGGNSLDHNQRVLDIQLTYFAAQKIAVEQVTLMQPETATLTHLGFRLPLSLRNISPNTHIAPIQIALETSVPTLPESLEIEMPDRVILFGTPGEHKTAVTTKPHTACNASKSVDPYIHKASIYQAQRFFYKHSATIIERICGHCGVLNFQLVHNNHGDLSTNKSMNHKCHGIWGNRSSRIYGDGFCRNSTSDKYYRPTDAKSGTHNCHDDSHLQYHEVRLDEKADRDRGYPAKPGYKNGRCNDEVWFKSPPACTDGFPVKVVSTLKHNSASWPQNITHMRQVDVNTIPFNIPRTHLFLYRSSDGYAQVNRWDTAQQRPGVVTQRTNIGKGLKVVTPVELFRATYLVMLNDTFVSVRKLSADGIIGPHVSGFPIWNTEWHYDIVEPLYTDDGVFLLMYRQNDAESGEAKVVALNIDGTFGESTYGHRSWKSWDNISTFYTSQGAYALLTSSSDKLVKIHKFRSDGTGILSTTKTVLDKPPSNVTMINSKEGTFVTFYNKGSGKAETFRVYENGILGYQLGRATWSKNFAHILQMGTGSTGSIVRYKSTGHSLTHKVSPRLY